VSNLRESFWGDLNGRTREAWKKFFEADSERQRDRFALVDASPELCSGVKSKSSRLNQAESFTAAKKLMNFSGKCFIRVNMKNSGDT
jgi:hypothetical protein